MLLGGKRPIIYIKYYFFNIVQNFFIEPGKVKMRLKSFKTKKFLNFSKTDFECLIVT